MNTKYHKDLYDNTIEEALFLCGILIGNVQEEDALLTEYYRGLFREADAGRIAEDKGAAPAGEQQTLPGEGLSVCIHAHLQKRRGFGNEPPDLQEVLGLVLRPETGRQSESLIASCYRERREAFRADPGRVRRLYEAIRGTQ